MQFLKLLVSSLARLGAKRLLLMVLVGVTVASMLGVSAYLLNRPVRETLYSGLDAEDVNRIGAALTEVGIPFDVSVTGNAVLVDYGKTAQARMILASKGLPKSDKAGYELFDQMGSLGLTSFMQQVTRVRALEGELVRTIQLLEGIKSARVHLGLKAEGTFRTKSDSPTASVIIRTDGSLRENVPNSVRQIVAAAIPGLRPEQVSVMTTDGKLLAAAGEDDTMEPDRILELERRVAAETQDRAERTVSAFLGMSNIRISVTAQLNVDKKQTTETNFDPESKVERSLKTVKENDESQNATGSQSVSAAQNVPQETQPSSGGDSAKEKKERKEETANYELNSKQIATTSNGYTLEKLSLAVVLNKQALLKSQGAAPDEAKLPDQIAEIEKLVRSAVGFNEQRGDNIRVSAIDFIAEDATLEPLAGPGFADILTSNLGTIINALSLLGAFLLVIFLGLRPMVKALISEAPASAAALPMDDFSPQIADMSGMGSGDFGGSQNDMDKPASAQDKLNKVVELDMDRAAQVLKQWLEKPQQGAA